ncbi:putative 30.3 kDa protein [Anticarsia gemmatalis]|uniref:putative 30.3 kDa protein n=1 Tax=Anticarsia gemmatalis TaxID=129554 RepID=UPI003F75736A
MKSLQLCFLVILSFVSQVLGEDTSDESISESFLLGRNDTVSSETASAYELGVHMGIINPEKYTLESFERDERNIFKDLYKEYISLNGSQPINYQQWLVMNNFGILPDTQESLFERKISKRSTADNKRRFVNTVKKGDILITGRGIGGLVGHAAIMSTDYWVLEMPGGAGWANGIKSNNRQVSKHKWFDEHASDWTTVYRCPDRGVANQAASWADRNYYNPSGGSKKTIHITYRITPDIWKKNPSYCSKLVIHAYYFGTGKKKVIRDLSVIGRAIVPSTIPSYFLSPYKLVNKGKY